MATTLSDLVGLETIAALFEKFPQHAAENSRLQDLFVARPDFVVDGDTVTWDEYSYTRKAGGFVARNAPAAVVDPAGFTVKNARLADIKLKQFIPARDILQVRALGANSTVRESAPAVVGRVLRDLRTKVRMTLEIMASDTLQGSLTFNTTKYPDSKINYPTVTYAIQTMTATASWATASTKVISSLNELPKAKDLLRKNAGVELARLLFSYKVGTYLINNTEVKDWLATTQQGVRVFNTAQIGAAGGLGGVSVEEYNGGYLDSADAWNYLLPDDILIGLSANAASDAGLIWAQGYGEIPANAISGESAEGLMPRRAPSPGFYAYAYTNPDPVGVWVVVGWRGFPLIQFPDAIIKIDSTP